MFIFAMMRRKGSRQNHLSCFTPIAAAGPAAPSYLNPNNPKRFSGTENLNEQRHIRLVSLGQEGGGAAQMKSALALRVVSEVRQNLAALEATREQLAIQTRVLERARQIRDLVRQEYVGGTAGITRMTEVQNEAVKADAGLVISRIDNLLNVEDLDAVTGKSVNDVTSGDGRVVAH